MKDKHLETARGNVSRWGRSRELAGDEDFTRNIDFYNCSVEECDKILGREVVDGVSMLIKEKGREGKYVNERRRGEYKGSEIETDLLCLSLIKDGACVYHSFDTEKVITASNIS